ncbi:MAG: hypothetical protein KDE11_01260 [Rhodobacteraceae bacterium]|nr:hypothetical protein [Paracoccaceae bacterium]
MVPQHDPDGGGHVRHRVVLGATCYADAEGGLTVAIELARHAGAELHGLLVQDEASLSAVRVMRARVLSFSGEPAAEVSEQALLSAYRADARRFAERLRGAARMARLRAEFRAVEGRLWDVVQQAAGPGGVVVFGYRRAVGDSGAVVLVLGRGRTVPGFASALAADLGKHLVVLAEGAPPAAMAGDVYAGPDQLVRRLSALSPAAVIVAADPAGLPPPARLVEAARCPVVLVTADAG